MKKNWLMRVLRFVAFAAVAATVFGFLVKDLWNWLMPPLFGQHALTFEQALGLLALSWILLGGFRGRPGHQWRGRLMEHWDKRAPEERERLRAALQGQRGPFAAPAPERKG